MTSSENKAKKAKLPSLEQRFAYRNLLRQTPVGVALEAMGGDKESIAQLANIGAALMRKASNTEADSQKDYAFWIGSILANIGNGVSPNEAFGWTVASDQHLLHNGEKFRDLRKKLLVATTVETFAISVQGGSYSDAVSNAAILWGIAELECRAAMSSVPPGKSKLSRTDGVGLALDMVAKYGASGYMGVARETASGYYKELIQSRGNE